MSDSETKKALSIIWEDFYNQAFESQQAITEYIKKTDGDPLRFSVIELTKLIDEFRPIQAKLKAIHKVRDGQ